MKKVRRVYQTGSFREVCDVWASDRYRPRGARIKGNARKSQMDANMKAAQRELTRILNGNYSYERGSLLCSLSFDQEPESREEAKKLFNKCWKELRKICRQNGRELKVCGVISDVDGDTGEKVRLHVHVVLDGCTMEQVRECWKLGVVDCRTIRKEKTHARLAAYLLKQCRCEPNEKKWFTSRNLERTKLLSETEIIGSPKYRLPKGAEIIAQGEYCPEEGKLLYLQIQMPEKGRIATPDKPARNDRSGKDKQTNKHGASRTPPPTGKEQ